ncbi:unnamed protein product, partial [Discosporangium mesarthrocarpum]
MNLLWVPGLPCRLPSTGALRQDGRGLRGFGHARELTADGWEQAEDRSHEKEQAFHRTDQMERAAVHSTFANKHRKLTLRDWQDILGHLNPSAGNTLKSAASSASPTPWRQICVMRYARSARQKHSAT